MFRMEINHVKRPLSFVNICNVVHNLRTWVTGPPGGGKVNERLYHNDERVTGTLMYILLSSGTQITYITASDYGWFSDRILWV